MSTQCATKQKTLKLVFSTCAFTIIYNMHKIMHLNIQLQLIPVSELVTQWHIAL